jgi:AcrR family transcriptional regulator
MAEKQQDRGISTRRSIVETATALFAARGYEAVSIETVLRETGMSRGALYYHFPDGKVALFTAVLEETEARIAAALAAAAQGATTPFEALRAGCAAWLRLAADDPAVRQIVLVDAPSVVGWSTWRDIDGRHAMGLLRAALNAAQPHLRADVVDLHAHLLLALLIEAALLIARSDREPAVMTEAGATVEKVLLSIVAG